MDHDFSGYMGPKFQINIKKRRFVLEGPGGSICYYNKWNIINKLWLCYDIIQKNG